MTNPSTSPAGRLREELDGANDRREAEGEERGLQWARSAHFNTDDNRPDIDDCRQVISAMFNRDARPTYAELVGFVIGASEAISKF